MRTLSICPRCNQRISRSALSGDYVHKCFGSEVLANEDILVIGDWEDFTGSNTNIPANVINAVQPDKLQGTRAGLEGDKEEAGRTRRGFPKSRFRTRQHLEYLDENFFNKKGVQIRNPEDYG